MDHILSAIRGNQDEQKHVEYLKELEQILLNEKPIWTLYTPIYYHISDNTLQGVQFNLIRTISDRLNNVSDWYIN
ncbi:MAG: hypothetical protein U9Q15_03935, partial [Patescibacteria group bacterium]|nr:hypothetical protein [Patescibacteria group bacterium]